MTKNTVKKNDIISNETENKIIIDNKKSIRIFFNNEEEVILKIDLDNKKVLIDEINSWIRSRFGLDSKTRLVYLDKDNEEILPSNEIIESGKLKIKSIEDNNEKKLDKKSTSSSSTPSSSNSSSSFFNEFAMLFLVCLFLFIFVSIKNNKKIGLLSYYTKYLDKILLKYNLIPKNSTNVSHEGFVTFLSWSFTYLFIRRAWNPETFKSFRFLVLYSSDSLCGGLAAGLAVIVKKILLHKLKIN